MVQKYDLRESLRENRTANLDDVWIVKQALKNNGYYDPPPSGMYPSPDRGLFEGIRKYQKEAGLRVDGIMKPKGETENSIQDLMNGVAMFRCTNCGGCHGGVYSPRVCSDCWRKGAR